MNENKLLLNSEFIYSTVKYSYPLRADLFVSLFIQDKFISHSMLRIGLITTVKSYFIATIILFSATGKTIFAIWQRGAWNHAHTRKEKEESNKEREREKSEGPSRISVISAVHIWKGKQAYKWAQRPKNPRIDYNNIESSFRSLK